MGIKVSPVALTCVIGGLLKCLRFWNIPATEHSSPGEWLWHCYCLTGLVKSVPLNPAIVVQLMQLSTN